MAAAGRSNGHDLGPETFVHLDVASAFSRMQSPSTPHDYVSALAQQFPLNELTTSEARPALAICDWGLQSAVKTAVACDRAGVDHLLGLRLRVVHEAAWHPWAEQPRELLLIAGDDEAWLSLVALSNLAHLSNADFRGPRVDWRDLEQHCRGELICLTGAPMVGVLGPLVENAADPGNPTEAVALTRRLAELFPHLYIELAYHHHPREKLINRGLVALAQRLDLPLVATNAVRFARKQDALTSRFSNALPLSKSRDTEAWSCAMSHLPSIFRKQYVARTQNPLLLFPFFNVPLSRLKLCANATSPPTVIVRSRISKPSGGWNIVNASSQFCHFPSAPTRCSGGPTSNDTMSGA